jgi:hypothetical protein
MESIQNSICLSTLQESKVDVAQSTAGVCAKAPTPRRLRLRLLMTADDTINRGGANETGNTNAYARSEHETRKPPHSEGAALCLDSVRMPWEYEYT